MSKTLIKISFLLSMLLSISLHSTTNDEQSSLAGDSNLLSDLFILRHSGKNFKVQPLTEDQIQALIQSARWTPSGFNDQPWNFIFCDRFTTPEAYVKVLDCISGQNWLDDIPLFVIVIARSNFLYNDKANKWANYDTGAAAFAMSLQATYMGLMAHQIGGFDNEKIIQEFNLPHGYSPLTIIAIGYEDTELPCEEPPRTRLPVSDNFFSGEWERSFNQETY